MNILSYLTMVFTIINHSSKRHSNKISQLIHIDSNISGFPKVSGFMHVSKIKNSSSRFSLVLYHDSVQVVNYASMVIASSPKVQRTPSSVGCECSPRDLAYPLTGL